MDKLYSISKTSEILDITPKTLRIWDKEGKLKPILTSGGHRRYKESDIKKITGDIEQESSVKECATYARVSSLKQKTSGDLDRQSQRLSEYCAKQGILVTHIIKDVGSGLNDKRSGFSKLTDTIIQGKISLVVIEHKDRLTRFQFNFISRNLKRTRLRSCRDNFQEKLKVLITETKQELDLQKNIRKLQIGSSIIYIR